MLVAQLCPTLCSPMTIAHQPLYVPWDSPGKNTGVGSHSLLQGIFLTQGANPGLLHCRLSLYHLSHWWKSRSRVRLFATAWTIHTVHGILQARIPEWVAFPFSRDLPNPGIEPRSPALQADSLPAEPQGKPLWKLPRRKKSFSSTLLSSSDWSKKVKLTGENQM